MVVVVVVVVFLVASQGSSYVHLGDLFLCVCIQFLCGPCVVLFGC